MEVGGKNRCMSALCLHFEKCKTPLSQMLMEISLEWDGKEGDVLLQMNESWGGRRSDPHSLFAEGTPCTCGLDAFI